jgi:hypothetical protein
MAALPPALKVSSGREGGSKVSGVRFTAAAKSLGVNKAPALHHSSGGESNVRALPKQNVSKQPRQQPERKQAPERLHRSSGGEDNVG